MPAYESWIARTNDMRDTWPLSKPRSVTKAYSRRNKMKRTCACTMDVSGKKRTGVASNCKKSCQKEFIRMA